MLTQLLSPQQLRLVLARFNDYLISLRSLQETELSQTIAERRLIITDFKTYFGPDFDTFSLESQRRFAEILVKNTGLETLLFADFEELFGLSDYTAQKAAADFLLDFPRRSFVLYPSSLSTLRIEALQLQGDPDLIYKQYLQNVILRNRLEQADARSATNTTLAESVVPQQQQLIPAGARLQANTFAVLRQQPTNNAAPHPQEPLTTAVQKLSQSNSLGSAASEDLHEDILSPNTFADAQLPNSALPKVFTNAQQTQAGDELYQQTSLNQASASQSQNDPRLQQAATSALQVQNPGTTRNQTPALSTRAESSSSSGVGWAIAGISSALATAVGAPMAITILDFFA